MMLDSEGSVGLRDGSWRVDCGTNLVHHVGLSDGRTRCNNSIPVCIRDKGNETISKTQVTSSIVTISRNRIGYGFEGRTLSSPPSNLSNPPSLLSLSCLFTEACKRPSLTHEDISIGPSELPSSDLTSKEAVGVMDS